MPCRASGSPQTAMLFPRSSGCSCISTLAVSYTHLDVYKRQEHGLLFTDVHGNTTRPGIFASGDVVLGARTVVEAVKYSKEVAQVMDEYLSSIQD